MRRSITLVKLHADNWYTLADFYCDLLIAIGAPAEHGRNINALVDSMVWGGMNKLEAPYVVQVHGSPTLPLDVLHHVELASQALAEGRAEFRARHGKDVEVSIELLR